MKNLKVSIAMLLTILMGFSPALSWAATAIATVSVTIPVTASIALQKGTNSDCTTPGVITFTTLDSQDRPGVGDGEKMYAPLISHGGKNWHETKMVSTGANTALTIAVTTDPTIGGKKLSLRLYVYCGGWWKQDGTMVANTIKDWGLAKSYSQTITQSFVGTSPFNYYVNVAGVPGGTTIYSGGITFSLVST